MSITYQHGMGDVLSLAKRAGEAKAAQIAQQQDFQVQMSAMNNQMQIAAEQRRQAWELEKMEIASRLDFQKSEQKRIKKETQYESAVDEINKRRFSRGGTFPDEKADEALFSLALQYQGVEDADRVIGLEAPLTAYQRASLAQGERRLDMMRDPVKEMMLKQLEDRQEGGAVQPEAASNTPVPMATPTFLGQQAMQQAVPLTDLDPKDIPQDSRGRFIVYDPKTGQSGTVPPAELPQYIEQGFVAIPVVHPYQTTKDRRIEKGLDPNGFNLPEAILGSKPELLSKAISSISGESEEERQARIAKRKKTFGFMNLGGR